MVNFRLTRNKKATRFELLLVEFLKSRNCEEERRSNLRTVPIGHCLSCAEMASFLAMTRWAI